MPTDTGMNNTILIKKNLKNQGPLPSRSSKKWIMGAFQPLRSNSDCFDRPVSCGPSYIYQPTKQRNATQRNLELEKDPFYFPHPLHYLFNLFSSLLCLSLRCPIPDTGRWFDVKLCVISRIFGFAVSLLPFPLPASDVLPSSYVSCYSPSPASALSGAAVAWLGITCLSLKGPKWKKVRCMK